MSEVKRAVLAYSGGLDTSVILKWLQDSYQCEVVTFTADIGQGEELEPARQKALKFGIKPEHIFIDDLREEFVRDFVFPMFRANAIYEGEYLLGTSIARPLDRQAPDRHRAPGRRRRRVPRRHRQGQRPGALRTRLLRARTQHPHHRAVARVGPAVAREAAGVRGEARHPCRDETQGRRQPLFDGRQPAAHLLRGAGAGRPISRIRGGHVALDGVAGEGAGRSGVHRTRLRSTATSSRSMARR